MTLRGLINKLEKLEKTVGPRAEVVIRLEEFRLVDDYYSHWGLHAVEHEFIPWTSHTGGRENKDGSEKMRNVVAIR